MRDPGATDEHVISVIKDAIVSNRASGTLTARQRGQMCHELFNRIRRLDILQDIIDDDLVTEIMVNGTDEIFVEREGRITGTGIRFESKERLAGSCFLAILDEALRRSCVISLTLSLLLLSN